MDPVAERIAAGDLRAAAGEYERLAKSERKLREHYQLLAARTWRDEGDFAELGRVLATIKLKKLVPAQRLEFDLLSAELAVSEQAFERALALLVMPALPSAEQSRQLELRARAESGLNRPLDAARTRLQLGVLLNPAERSGNIDEMVSELGKLPAESLVAELKALPADATMRPYIEVMLQRQKLMPPRAKLPVAGVINPAPNSSEPGYRPVQKLALLVPTRGEFAAAGEVIRDGFLSAHFARKDAGKVQVFDTGASRKTALAAFQQAIDAGFTQFVGPLEREQVDAVLLAAKPQHQILALNQPAAGSLTGIDSFRFGLAPENDGAAAADALMDLAHKRFIVVGTEEDWSMRATDAFRVQVEAMGGSVVALARIKSGTIDFANELAKAAEVFKPSPTALPAAAADSAIASAPVLVDPAVPHDYGVDAVFIAVRVSDARLLVPQLRVRGLDALPIVAAPQVFTTANPALDGDLNGVSFLDAPWAHNQGDMQPPRMDLAEFLPGALQSPRLFAFGMDAYLLFSYREYLRDHQGSQLPGANGRLQIDPQGRVRRSPVWFRFIEGAPVSQELLPARP
ncbi:MAG: penicillin-binding protein activator [Ahniella sp.]|nr:penicillin-binding protein activator [Ahniella sp.]